MRSAKRGAAPGPSGRDCGALAPLVGFSQGPTVAVQVGAASCRGWHHSNFGRGHQDGQEESTAQDERRRGRVEEARTMAQQLGPQMEAATAPHQTLSPLEQAVSAWPTSFKGCVS